MSTNLTRPTEKEHLDRLEDAPAGRAEEIQIIIPNEAGCCGSGRGCRLAEALLPEN